MSPIVLDPGVALNLAVLACEEEMARDCGLQLLTAPAALDETNDAGQIGNYLDYSLHATEEEARAAALAHSLAASLATDSPKMRVLVSGRGGQTSSTLTLLVAWMRLSRMPEARQARLASELSQKALFVPPRCDPHIAWWTQHHQQRRTA